MKRNKIKEFFGLKFVYNKTSKQIHRIEKLTPNCFFESIVDGKYCTEKRAIKLIKENSYDGCRYCWNEMNNYKK